MYYLRIKPCIFVAFFKQKYFMHKYLIIVFLSLSWCSYTNAQSFGIRAGLNYTKFSSPLETGVNEKYSLTNGFHFGVNYAYKFNNILSLKGELLYTQIGTKYNYDGASYYKLPYKNAFIFKKGNSVIDMEVSNAYISIPITFQWQASKKFELYGGGYFSFLIGPKGNGTLEFVNNVDSLFFRQSLIHSYYKDVAGGIATSNIGPSVWVDGIVVTLARDAGAYYNYLENEKVGDLYKVFDMGLIGGVNYFVNKGFYIGLRYNYGLRDVTNDKVEFLRKTYDEENNLDIRANRFTRNVGYEVSLGFRF